MNENNPVLFHTEGAGRIGVITLNRADNRNSMTPELLAGFGDVVAHVRTQDALRVVIITGRGRCFSAGADFKSQVQVDGGSPDKTLMSHEKSFGMYQPFLAVTDIEVPVIGALNGHAVGGGFGLASVCDLRVVNATAKYGANFTRIGLHPGMALSYLMPRLMGVPRALELLLTGRLFLGDEGATMGWASQAVAGDAVWSTALALAETIAQNAPVAIRTTKRTFYELLDWQAKRAAHTEAYAQAVTVNTDDFKEGMAALLGKRDPDFKGH